MFSFESTDRKGNYCGLLWMDRVELAAPPFDINSSMIYSVVGSTVLERVGADEGG